MRTTRSSVWASVLCGLILTSAGAMAAEAVAQYEVSEEVVRDRLTGLVWQRKVPHETRTFEEAKSYCETARIGNTGGWRLPTVSELQTLVDVRASSPAVDKRAFPNMLAQVCWTSTPYAGSEATRLWAVAFKDGNGRSLKDTDPGHVICVRKRVSP